MEKMEKIRIQKLLSESGVGSRRDIEQMILDGRILVNGEIVNTLPYFVTPRDEIMVDSQPVRKRAEAKVYVLLNKPRGTVCTARDEKGYDRPKAIDLVPNIGARVYCVGRLDEDSTGLILMTNDGELTQRLTHPRFGVDKTYVARISGNLTGPEIERLKKGLFVAGGRTGPAAVKVSHRGSEESLVEVRISEGRNRQIRRMLAQLGHKVRRLHRTAIGPLQDKGLKIGSWRHLTPAEVTTLRKISGMEQAAPKALPPTGHGRAAKAPALPPQLAKRLRTTPKRRKPG